nr:hypothetical protein [Tanacetum cinerariifolium]
MNEANMKAMQTQIINVKNELRNEMKNSIQASMYNQTNELKNMMASFFQMNIASTLGSEHLPSNTIANPKGELKSIITRSGIVLGGPSVPIPHLFINLEEDERVEETLTDQNLAEYTIKVPPPLVQKPKPPSQRNFVVHQWDPLHPNIPYPSRMHKQKQQEKEEKLLELANTALNENCSAVILKKLQEKFGNPGKFLIPCGFSELKCKTQADLGASINLMPLSVWKKLGLPELIFTRMTLKLAYWEICTPTGITNDVFVLERDSILKDLVNEDNLVDLNDNLADTMPEMFTEEHALDYSFSPLYDEYDDDLFEVKSNTEYMFTEEHALDYSFSPLYDEYDDDLFEVKSNTEYVYDDPFDFKGEKIKESKLLINELDLPRSSDFPPSSEYDSFLFEDFSKDDAFPSTNNEDK